MNHFSEDCVAAAHRNTSWATRQVETAANFCVDSWFWSLSTCCFGLWLCRVSRACICQRPSSKRRIGILTYNGPPHPTTVTAGIHIQIEHHLFPGISSDKLLPLCPIVEETCKEFGVNYKSFKVRACCLRLHGFIMCFVVWARRLCLCLCRRGWLAPLTA